MRAIKEEAWDLLERRKQDKRDEIEEEDGMSNCCGATIIYQDICSDCKEHCDVFEEE